MKKNIYVRPQALVVTINPMRLVATSLDKTEEEFDPENMTFTKEERTNTGGKSVWDEEW